MTLGAASALRVGQRRFSTTESEKFDEEKGESKKNTSAKMKPSICMSQNTQNYLGIDWGAANIGVALAHRETGVALPYATLPNDKDAVVALGKIIAAENIGTVVIGVPVYVHQEDKEYPGETLGKLLAEHFSVRVAYQNEMFTTKMAEANLIERGEKGASKRNDEEAARIILQEWLDIQNTRSNPHK
ncbi:MAG: hypothetical protein A3E38_02415 [Candidatus Moranbacteria bacterium RIFCSPHIGHO2_12_FULL_54_9]|nr:MAG: hypothetical protein A3E38_02415 [Candidatus Moranbacteria bacterium RIFCSPHIGHO2_12_FULL_54_9]